MYIDDSRTYFTTHGEQRHEQGDFLILASPEEERIDVDEPNIYALVRQVALEQFGHFMMGTARIGGESYTISGAYGNMGLTMDLPRDVIDEYAVQVPRELAQKWKTGGGHNSAGSEGYDFKRWANENIDRLTPDSDRRRTATH